MAGFLAGQVMAHATDPNSHEPDRRYVFEKPCPGWFAAPQVAPGGNTDILLVETYVRDAVALARLQSAATLRIGRIDVLFRNKGVWPDSSFFGPPEDWAATLETNLLRVIQAVQTSVSALIERCRRGFVVVTGFKQGTSTPPAGLAYNFAKTGVKWLTEALAQGFQYTEKVTRSAHLRRPGFVFTDLSAWAK